MAFYFVGQAIVFWGCIMGRFGKQDILFNILFNRVYNPVFCNAMRRIILLFDASVNICPYSPVKCSQYNFNSSPKPRFTR
jgi:hypothetical protein